MIHRYPIQLLGAIPSPYTRKMLALLRYRRIPYKMLWGDPKKVLKELGLDEPKVLLLPMLLLQSSRGDLEVVCDSTPIMRRLETEHLPRSVIPKSGWLAFVDYLLEDFADEWVTKCMFHFRWHFRKDADNAGTLLPLYDDIRQSHDEWADAKAFIMDRQIGRLGIVGSNKTTAHIIESSYVRLLELLEAHFTEQPFLLGGRPGASDFAMYGQLTQLIGLDPTSRNLSHKKSPRAVVYTGLMEDQSGLEPDDDDWISTEDIPSTLKQILREVGRVYVPALLANYAAKKAGELVWEAEIDGMHWEQSTFSYQAKCLNYIRAEYASMGDFDRSIINGLFSGTGCGELWSGI